MMCVCVCVCVYGYVCMCVSVRTCMTNGQLDSSTDPLEVFRGTPIVVLVSVHLWTLGPTNDIRMYLPLATVAGVHLRGVRERLPACCTLAQVLHSLVNLAVPLSKNSRKFFSGRTFFFLGYPLFLGRGARRL
jgi:hypothetical protein